MHQNYKGSCHLALNKTFFHELLHPFHNPTNKLKIELGI
jgi:hypothetical protein